MKKKIGRFINIAFYVSRGTFWGIILVKIIYFFNVYGLWAKAIRTFGKRNWVKLQRMNSTCPGERFEDFILGKKHVNFYRFQILSRNRSDARWRFPGGSSNLRLTSPEECFEVFWEFDILIVTFVLWAKKQINVWRKIFVRIVKLPWIQRKMLGRIFCSGNLNLFSSISRPWAKFCGISGRESYKFCFVF